MSGFLRGLAARGAGLGSHATPRREPAHLRLGAAPAELAAEALDREHAPELAAVGGAGSPPVAATAGPPVAPAVNEAARIAPLERTEPEAGVPEHAEHPPAPAIAVSRSGPATEAAARVASLQQPPTEREPVHPDRSQPASERAPRMRMPPAVELHGVAARARPAPTVAAVPSAAALEAGDAKSPEPVPPPELVVAGSAVPPPMSPWAAAAVASESPTAGPAAAPGPTVGPPPTPRPAPAVPASQPAPATPPTRALHPGPAQEPAIEIRIGRIEVRPPRPPDPPPPSPRAPVRGFDDLALARRGLDRRWY